MAELARATEAEASEISLYPYNPGFGQVEQLKAVYSVGDLGETYYFNVLEGDRVRPTERRLQKDVGNRRGTSVTSHNDVEPVPASIAETLRSAGYELADGVQSEDL